MLHKVSFKTIGISKLLCLSLLLSVSANSHEFNELNTIGNITDIHQDNESYIWLSTIDGLSRYDGKELLKFSTNEITWKTPFSWVNSIEPFQDKIIVSSAVNGLFLFDPQTGTSSEIELPEYIQNPDHATYFKGYIYFENRDAIYRYNLTSLETTLIKDDVDLFGMQATNDNLYILSRIGICHLANDKFNNIFPNQVDTFTSVNNNLIFQHEGQLLSMIDTRVVAKTDVSDIQSLASGASNSSVLAITSNGDVLKFSSTDMSVIPSQFTNIGKQLITKTFYDRSGALWIYSNLGLSRHYEKTISNTEYIFDIKDNSNELMLVNGELLIGSYGNGLQTLTPQPWFDPKMNNSLSPRARYTTGMLRHKDTIIFGTLDGVWQYQLGDSAASRLPLPKNEDIVLALRADEDNLYIGTNFKGLKIYNWQSQQVTQRINKQHGLYNLEVIDVLPQTNGDIWFATANGLEIYQKGTNDVRQLSVNLGIKFISLAEANNKIYAFSMGGGVYVFNKQGDVLSIMGKGINFSRSLIIGDDIWTTTTSGIYRIDTKSDSLAVVLGTESYSFSGLPVYHNNKVYGWHTRGYVEIDHAENAVFNAPIRISKTSVSGIEQLNNERILLSSAKDVVSLNVASLDYRSNANKKFKYRIDDSIWTPIQGNQITLAGLSSGEYVVEVKGTNSQGQWSSYVAYTNIAVAYPWYWTPQVRVIYLLLVVIFVILSIWLILLRARSISSVYKVLDEDLKTRGLLSNNLERNINVSLRMLHEGDQEKAIKLLTDSAQLISNNKIKDEPRSLNNQSLSGGLEYLVDFWQVNYAIKVRVKTDYPVDTLTQSIQQSIYRIIYHAIDSALSHSRSDTFMVSIQPFNQKLWLKIEDDNDYFSDFDSKVDFNIAMYTIRKIATQHDAKVNAYKTGDNNSQLTVSFNLDEHINNNI